MIIRFLYVIIILWHLWGMPVSDGGCNERAGEYMEKTAALSTRTLKSILENPLIAIGYFEKRYCLICIIEVSHENYRTEQCFETKTYRYD